MGTFKLNRDFNGSKEGDTVTVPNHLDGEMVRNKVGVKLGTKAEPEAPKNKAIKKAPKNK